MSPSRPVPLPSLLVEDSVTGRRTVPLDREITRLGRRNDNDVQLLESHISKRHADILRRGDRFVVVDVGSKAGVYVNGAQVTERVLEDGDVITLGSTPTPSILFHRDGSTATRPAVPDLLSTLTTLTAGAAGRGLESLAKFLEFSRLCSGQLDLDSILENVVDLAAEVTGAERSRPTR